MRLRWLARARRQRSDAIDWIAQDHPQAALDQLDAIEHAADQLIDHPRLGRRGRVAGTRERVVPGTPFILIYRVRDDDVQILRLLHHAQQRNADQ